MEHQEQSLEVSPIPSVRHALMRKIVDCFEHEEHVFLTCSFVPAVWVLIHTQWTTERLERSFMELPQNKTRRSGWVKSRHHPHWHTSTPESSPPDFRDCTQLHGPLALPPWPCRGPRWRTTSALLPSCARRRSRGTATSATLATKTAPSAMRNARAAGSPGVPAWCWGTVDADHVALQWPWAQSLQPGGHSEVDVATA